MVTMIDVERVLGTGAAVIATQGLHFGASQSRERSRPPHAYALPGHVVAPLRGSTTGMVSFPDVWTNQRIPVEAAAFYESPWSRIFAANSVADRWERDNLERSRVRGAEADPAYTSLRTLGDSAIALALRRLSGGSRPLWLFFLRSAVNARPAAGMVTVDEAALAWRRWGRQQGLLP